MASIRPHAYHLPSESEMAHTQLIISHRRDKIQSIEQSIESERVSLDTAIERLDTTFAPLIAKIREDIKREEAKLVVLEIKRAASKDKLRKASERNIQDLEKERALLDKEIGNDKGFIAPIRRLPSELLSEIFVWFEVNGNPWPLTKVCRSWRGVALRTPQLWGHIIITESKAPIKFSYNSPYGYNAFSHRLKTAPSEDGREGAQRCKTIKGLETALKLAGNTLLRVVISIGNPEEYIYSIIGSPMDTSAVRQERIGILELLTQHFPRIQSLIIRNLPDLKRTESMEEFTSIFQGKLPNLRELEVNPTTRNVFINTLMTSVQTTARNLKSLTYAQPSGLWGNMHVEINTNLDKDALSTLTSLRIGSSTMPFQSSAWECMVHLQELEFSAQNLTEWSGSALTSLVRLTITGGTATDLGGHFPRLKYLCLDDITLSTPAFSISTPLLDTLVLHTDHIEVARMLNAPLLDSLDMCCKNMKKSDANQLVAMVWSETSTTTGKCLNPRKLRIDVDANDTALVKALKQMDRLENLQLGIRPKMNVRKRVLADLAIIAKKNTKGVKEGVPTVCPNLKRLEIFPGQTTRERPLSGPGDKLLIQTLLNEITTARPDVECVLKEEEYLDGGDFRDDMFWGYD